MSLSLVWAWIGVLGRKVGPDSLMKTIVIKLRQKGP